jgi:hypothetical protein
VFRYQVNRPIIRMQLVHFDAKTDRHLLGRDENYPNMLKSNAFDHPDIAHITHICCKNTVDLAAPRSSHLETVEVYLRDRHYILNNKF